MKHSIAVRIVGALVRDAFEGRTGNPLVDQLTFTPHGGDAVVSYVFGEQELDLMRITEIKTYELEDAVLKVLELESHPDKTTKLDFRVDSSWLISYTLKFEGNTIHLTRVPRNTSYAIPDEEEKSTNMVKEQLKKERGIDDETAERLHENGVRPVAWERTILVPLGKEHDVEIEELNVEVHPGERLTGMLTRDICEKHCLVPVGFYHAADGSEKPIIAMRDPGNKVAIKDVEFRIGSNFLVRVATTPRILAAIKRWYKDEGLNDDGDQITPRR